LIFNLNYFHRIGVTEKGFATLELNVEMSPGHSSIPPKETAIGVLAKAVSALETNPHPSMFGNGPEMDFFSKINITQQNVTHTVVLYTRPILDIASSFPTCGSCRLCCQRSWHEILSPTPYKEQPQLLPSSKEDTNFGFLLK
jgi:hypothetical protein